MSDVRKFCICSNFLWFTSSKYIILLRSYNVFDRLTIYRIIEEPKEKHPEFNQTIIYCQLFELKLDDLCLNIAFYSTIRLTTKAASIRIFTYNETNKISFICESDFFFKYYIIYYFKSIVQKLWRRQSCLVLIKESRENNSFYKTKANKT